jgi:hypothetical protein
MDKKFIITNNQDEVQSWLDMGYEIEQMVPLHIAVGSGAYGKTYDGRIAVYLIKKN